MLLESDIVQFVVGTRINEAHQDPNIPVELDLRRNIVKRISHQLEQAYLKQTSIRYL
jgi:predicted XRE-type DNA-binding protein